MKIIGSILIIVASVTISFHYEKQQKAKITLLKSILNFIEYLKNQIEFFSLPLDVIYRKYSSQNEYLTALTRGEVLFPCTERIKDELLNCFGSIGTGYKSEEIKKLEYLAMKISDEITYEEKEISQKIKVFRAISLFIGCSTVILLV